MAVPLETRIMEAIGLGNHYSWYNGSGSCRYIRTEAARRLCKAIGDAKDSGEDIDSPNHLLINLAKMVAAKEDRYTLTNTWEVCSYIIQAHLHKDEENYRFMERYLRRRYLEKELTCQKSTTHD